MNNNRKTGGALALLCVMLMALVGVFASPASAQPICVITPTYEGTAVIGVVGGTTVTPGETITLEGSGFPPNCTLEIIVDGGVVGTVVTDGTGSFSTGVTLGSTISGTVTVGVQAGDFVRTITLQVEGAPVTTTTAAPTTTTAAVTPAQPLRPAATGPLPITGGDSSAFLAAGVALVVLGGLTVLAVRRRNEA
ncbi:MAG: LPXTG cell wall anchor domain-containing protein [Acidimicrobiia bacterium]|nr:LPXTG cell wall anchor domain-containing protein [Acidimicrobiia bacterium]